MNTLLLGTRTNIYVFAVNTHIGTIIFVIAVKTHCDHYPMQMTMHLRANSLVIPDFDIKQRITMYNMSHLTAGFIYIFK